MKKETYLYSSTWDRLRNEYKIFLLAFLFIIIADSIGQIQIPVGPGTLILFPIFYALLLGVLSGPEALKIFKTKEVKAASKLVIVAICPFIAKLGINAGATIETVISAGPALIFQEIGNLGTIFFALPVALLLGLKREAIGATHSINRESNLALITDMFGPDSPETQGSLSIYVVGGMVGTIFFGFMTTMVASLNIFHPYALGMASGVGAGILMASATASLSVIYPDMAAQLSALASTSETLSGLTGIYVAIFVGIPLTQKLYEIMEPKFARLRHEPPPKQHRRKTRKNNMRYLEWILLLVISGLGIGLANFVGFQVGFMDSLPGILVLLAISAIAVVCTKLIPLRLPIVAYCSILGLLAASPISPIREFVIESANKINFTAPLTLVGAYAGISISDQIRSFLKQGWKMIIVGILVMTGTFLGSAVISQLILGLTGAI